MILAHSKNDLCIVDAAIFCLKKTDHKISPYNRTHAAINSKSILYLSDINVSFCSIWSFEKDLICWSSEENIISLLKLLLLCQFYANMYFSHNSRF